MTEPSKPQVSWEPRVLESYPPWGVRRALRRCCPVDEDPASSLPHTPPMSVSQGPPGTVETCVYSAQMGLVACARGASALPPWTCAWPSSPVSFQLPFHPRGPCQDPKAPCFLPLLFRSMAGLHLLPNGGWPVRTHPFLLREGQLSGAKAVPPRGAWARVTKCSGLSLC